MQVSQDMDDHAWRTNIRDFANAVWPSRPVPEQAANWDWISSQIHQASRTLKVLNLFAYTGGSTLAAAAAGAEVVHVDSAKNIVAWARRKRCRVRPC